MGTAQEGGRDLARRIDHTILKLDATEDEVRRVCAEARDHWFRSVCVRVGWLGLVAKELEGHVAFPVAVVGFHEGMDSDLKRRETAQALMLDAAEVDMVIRRDLLYEGDYRGVERDIREVVLAAEKMPVKVIFESHLLTPEQIITSCQIAKSAGAKFVKTCTGFTGGGATVEAVRLMRRTVGPEFGVKASGGIRDRATAFAMIEAGANVLGCSSSVAIVRGGAVAGAY